MFQNKAIHKQALWCFFLFLVLSKFSFSQSTDVNLIFQIPENNPWDNPLVNPNSGFYLNTPVNLKPQLEYDPLLKLYSVEQKINGFRLSNPTFLSAEEYGNYNSRMSILDYWKQKVKSNHVWKYHCKNHCV